MMFSTIFLQAQGDAMSSFLPMILIMVVMFVLFLWPQMRKQSKDKKFHENLKKGQRVVLTSGLHGKIAEVMEDGVIIETMSGKLKFEKASISREYTQTRFPEAAE